MKIKGRYKLELQMLETMKLFDSTKKKKKKNKKQRMEKVHQVLGRWHSFRSMQFNW